MPSSRAVVFTAPDQPLALREFDVPAPRGGEILVRVTGCTLCGSDLHTLEGRRNVPVPTILGHEIIGTIDRFGPDAPRHDAAGRELQPGDRVTWSIVANCGDCFYCRRDLPQKCGRMVKYGHEPLRPGGELTGGLAEYCLLAQGTAVFRLPNELPDEVACPANCATATVAAALEAAGALDGRAVLVLGAGMLGLTACAMARACGAAEVICVDVNAARLKLAQTFGATRVCTPEATAETVKAATGDYGVDAALELTGATPALESGLAQLRIGGTLVLVGAVFPTPAVSLLPEALVRRCLTLRGVHNYAPRHLQAALEFLATAQAYPFASLVSAWHPLESLAVALEQARAAPPLRLGIRP